MRQAWLSLPLACEIDSPDSGAMLNQSSKDCQGAMSFTVAVLGPSEDQALSGQYNLTDAATVFLPAEGMLLRMFIHDQRRAGLALSTG